MKRKARKPKLALDDLKWLHDVTGWMLKNPAVCDEPAYALLCRVLASELPALRKAMNFRMGRDLVDSEVFEFTKQVAKIYQNGSIEPSDKRAAILGLIRDSSRTIRVFFNPDKPTEEVKEAIELLLSTPETYPTDAAIEAVHGVFKAHGIRGYSPSEFKVRRKRITGQGISMTELNKQLEQMEQRICYAKRVIQTTSEAPPDLISQVDRIALELKNLQEEMSRLCGKAA